MSVKPSWPGQKPQAARRDAAGPEMLLIIDVPEALALIASTSACMPQCPAVVLTRYAMLDAELLRHIKPDCILLPLLRPGFDIAQALQRLARLSYRGTIRVLGQTLPDHAMVEAELRAFAPDLHVHLIEIPAP